MSSTNELIKNATELAKVVPIYQDAIQPAAIEVGQSLQLVAKTVNKALSPLKAMVWGIERIEEYVCKRVSEKLKDVPPERVVSPEPHIAVPALLALSYSAHQETLRELYASLLATSMDSATARFAHPSFVEIIKALSPDEAKVIQLFHREKNLPTIDVNMKDSDGNAYSKIRHNYSHVGLLAKCEHPELAPNYLDNLGRLGLIHLPAVGGVGLPHLRDESLYSDLENSPELLSLKFEIEQAGKKFAVIRTMVGITNLGQQFCDACLDLPHGES